MSISSTCCLYFLFLLFRPVVADKSMNPSNGTWEISSQCYTCTVFVNFNIICQYLNIVLAVKAATYVLKGFYRKPVRDYF